MEDWRSNRIDEIYNAICDIFNQYNVTEQEVNYIIKQSGIEYILSLKKRLKWSETKRNVQDNDKK